MESELERFHGQNMQLELNIDELRQKLKASEKETLRERQKVRLKTHLLPRDAVLARYVLSLCVCPSVCLSVRHNSQAGTVPKRLNI